MDMIGPFLKQLVQSPNKSTTRNFMEYCLDCFKSEEKQHNIYFRLQHFQINSTLGP